MRACVYGGHVLAKAHGSQQTPVATPGPVQGRYMTPCRATVADIIFLLSPWLASIGLKHAHCRFDSLHSVHNVHSTYQLS